MGFHYVKIGLPRNTKQQVAIFLIFFACNWMWEHKVINLYMLLPITFNLRAAKYVLSYFLTYSYKLLPFAFGKKLAS